MTQPTPIPQRPECDISKTSILAQLFTIPQEQRDEQWRNTFLENVETASFRCGSPQILQGPDGFPYFALFTPEPMTPFESYCIRNMKDDFLLANGWGVVINPTGTTADWVFSHGDIVNLHVNQQFYTEPQHPEVPITETIETEENVLVGQPSLTFVPAETRNIIRGFLQKNGIETPSFFLMARKMQGVVVQQLVFNIFREDFAQEKFDELMRPVSWLLPRHYILIIIPKDSDLTKNFSAI